MKLDRADLDILGVLSRDSSVTNKALAAAVGLSQSACRERVLRLERSGAICGYRAIVATDIGRGAFEGWVSLSLSALPVSTHEAFAKFAQKSKNLAEVYQTTGAYDYVLHFVGSENEWREFCDALNAIGVSIDRVHFARVLRNAKRHTVF
jgi:Lrp/AsnC family leucine-responsive transcriptional regulator